MNDPITLLFLVCGLPLLFLVGWAALWYSIGRSGFHIRIERGSGSQPSPAMGYRPHSGPRPADLTEPSPNERPPYPARQQSYPARHGSGQYRD